MTKNVFSCCAELAEDVDQLDAVLKKLPGDWGRTWEPLLLSRGPGKEPAQATDVKVEMHADISFEEMRAIIRGLDGCHIMLESLRPVPLKENSLERDASVYAIYP